MSCQREEHLVHDFDQDAVWHGGHTVDSALWFTFAGYNYPHHSDPRYDLDMASYGLVKITDGAGGTYPDMHWEPKAAFHALAAAHDTAHQR